ncbi:Hint domain-containing protein [uncultured Roseobacter sp.]|uniref:Hint domain-containing protein n=1 Tax=uncultured Roseobacter sp. TaxID=114847 RepID=UPI0026145854|nr:Hint domain-containing protein [uncultured Roseobacter sp.]
MSVQDHPEHPSTRAIPDTGGLAENTASGLVHGARVLTLRGEIPVQALVPGDRLVSPGAVMAEVRRVEMSSVIARGVYVIAGSLGHARRTSDTLLAAGQPVRVRDWRAMAFTGMRSAWMPALSLVDGEYVRDIGLAPMTLYRIFCDGAKILCADGMEMGSGEVTAEALFASTR